MGRWICGKCQSESTYYQDGALACMMCGNRSPSRYLAIVSVVFLTVAILVGSAAWKFWMTVTRQLQQAFGG